MASKDSLYERLRSGTRRLHDELEGAVAIQRRLETRHGYVEHLLQLWALHSAVEGALRRVDFAPAGFAYPFPYRAQLLEIDLANLGVAPESLSELAIPSAPHLPTAAAGLGCVYVVEGSAKGARAVLPQVKQTLGLDPSCGASFFAGFGQDTSRLWRSALAAMDGIAPWSDQGDAAMTAATETFEMYREGLLAPPRNGGNGSRGTPVGADNAPQPVDFRG